MKKYEFTGEVKEYLGVTLHRIRALINFNDVEKGELGGFIEKEENLSHYNDAWVYDNARVAGNAFVYGNAMVADTAFVDGDAWVYENARVYGNAIVSDNARVFGDSWVYDNAIVDCYAMVYESAVVGGNAMVSVNAGVSGNAIVHGYTRLHANADVFRTNHYLSVSAIGSRFDFVTFYRDAESGIMVSCGCFLGKLEEFKEEVKETHRDNKHAQVYLKACELAKLQLDLKEI